MSSFWGSKAPVVELPEIVKVPAVHLEETVKDLPAELVATLDAKVDELYTLFSPNTEGLQQFIDKDGLVGKKRTVKDLVHMRAEYTLPFNIAEVFGVLTNSADQLSTDSMKKEQSKLKVISKHTWIEYFVIKAVRFKKFRIIKYTETHVTLYFRSGPSVHVMWLSCAIGDCWRMDLCLLFISLQLPS